MRSPDAFQRTLLIAIVAALAACKSAPPAPHDVLDDQTGATVTVVGAPITFSRVPDAKSTHNYLTLDAIQKDDAGQYTAMLLLYRWFAYYSLDPASPGPGSGELIIEVDGRSIRLQPLPQLPAGLPKAEDLFVPDKSNLALRAYVTDLATLKQIASSHEIELRLPDDSPEAFLLWQDGRPALQEFIRHLGGGAATP